MNTHDAHGLLLSSISVTRQQVAIAKAYILSNFQRETSRLIESFLVEVEAETPNEIVVHPSVDTAGQVKNAALGISWTLSICEAIWGLISINALIPCDGNLSFPIRNISYTTVVPGSGGHGGGWDLSEFRLPIPSRLFLSPSHSCQKSQPLSDPDLFMRHLEIPDIHRDIEESLREAARCFRNDLYIACLAMLGKASEGAWIELGIKLASVYPDGDKRALKLIEEVKSNYAGVSRKIDKIQHAYNESNIFGQIHIASGVRPSDLRACTIWADVIRESRNSVHYGFEPSMPNSYEKVSALLIGAAPHIRLLYKIIKVIDSPVS